MLQEGLLSTRLQHHQCVEYVLISVCSFRTSSGSWTIHKSNLWHHHAAHLVIAGLPTPSCCYLAVAFPGAVPTLLTVGEQDGRELEFHVPFCGEIQHWLL